MMERPPLLFWFGLVLLILNLGFLVVNIVVGDWSMIIVNTIGAVAACFTMRYS